MGIITGGTKMIFKSIWGVLKIIYFVISLLVVLAIAAAIYCAYPLYISPKPDMPSTLNTSDYVYWKFYRSTKNPDVYQKFKVYQDGTNEMEITREQGDYDIEMLGSNINAWHPKLDQERGIIVFKRQDLIPKEEAKNIFRKSIKAGILNLQDETHSRGSTLEIGTKIGEKDPNIFIGPDKISNPIDFPPKKWVNKIYWQQIIAVIDQNPKVKLLTEKTEYANKRETEVYDAIKNQLEEQEKINQ